MAYFLRIFSFILFYFIFQKGNAQVCFCQKDSFLNEIISCDTITLKGSSIVYYQFDCSASWLTFENSKGSKSIIFYLDSELIDLTYKLGWHVWKDYDDKVLFVARETSGLPTSLYYSLLDKNNGEIINSFNHVVYACHDSTCDFVLYFSDSTFNYLSLFMLKSGKEYKIEVPQNAINGTGFMYVENLFDQPTINGKVYTFPYYYYDEKKKKERTDSLIIDLNKYAD